MTAQFNAQQRRDFLKSLAALTGSLPLWAQAQSSWPTKPVTMVVPFPAGGGTDAFARPLSAQFAKLTGKQLIIDNRGGGQVGPRWLQPVHGRCAPHDCAQHVPQAGLRPGA